MGLPARPARSTTPRTRRPGLRRRLSTPYVNSIPAEDEPELPGDPELERLATALVRWNAIAIVLQANAESTELGGHIASYQSAETLYEVGFNHFWRARSEDHLGDLVYLQGHSSPGFYARAFLEGRLSEDELRRFRQEVGGGGLSSYPHPWLMPDVLAVPDGVDGARPADGDLPGAVHEVPRRARDRRARATARSGRSWATARWTSRSRWARSRSRAASGSTTSSSSINCNLQRLDGPVRGNGKIIQELETNFRGAGWNVIKVIWGSNWDPLLEADDEGGPRAS